MLIKDPCCYKINTCDTNPFDYRGHLQDIDIVTIIMGVGMIFGTIISVLPQIIRLIQRKTVIGISFPALIVSVTNQWSYILNLIFANISKMNAITQDFYKTMQNTLPVFQSFALFLSYSVTLHLYLICESIQLKQLSLDEDHEQQKKERRQNLIFYASILSYMIISLPITLGLSFLFGSCHQANITLGFIFGVISSVCSCLEWIPQIIKTYRTKSQGSFSLFAMCIQCPGCLLSTIITITSGNPWYVWIPWVVSFLLELILVILLIYYTCQNKRQQKLLIKELNSEAENNEVIELKSNDDLNQQQTE